MMYYIGTIPCDPNPLEHFGIKGMKWGVRRFQNKDGTRTEAGKKRYTNNFNEFVKSTYATARDKKTIRNVKEKMDMNTELRQKRDEYSLSSKNLFDCYNKYHSKLVEDRGRAWDGDGSEEHDELIKRYPEYAKAAKKEYDSKKDYVYSLLDYAEKGYFDDVLGDATDFKDSIITKNGTRSELFINGKAYAAALISSDGDRYSDFFDMEFKTSSWYRDRDGKEESLKLRFFD